MKLAVALVMVGAVALPSHPGAPGAGQDAPSIIRTCDYPARPDRRLDLPAALREVSGFAWHGGALLAHQDEAGRLYRIEPATGATTRWSTLERDVRDDFEGLAIVDSTAWLMTSAGRLYRFAARSSETPMPWQRFETGFGKDCELEGLAALPDGILLLPCKTGGRDLVIHRWDSRTDKAAMPATLRVPAAALEKAGAKRFRASAIEWDPISRHLLVVSSSPAMLLELDAAGAVVALVRLQGHPQPEGIALGSDRALYIGDEGGRGAASLSRYPCAK